MLVEERAARKRLQDQLERISSLAERNETTLRDRTAYLEKLRTQDALDLREAKDRLRQVETEILQYKIAGEGSGTRVSMAGYVDASKGGAAGNRQIPGASQQAGILPGMTTQS